MKGLLDGLFDLGEDLVDVPGSGNGADLSCLGVVVDEGLSLLVVGLQPVLDGLGLVVVVFGTWGDLVESLFKRTLGIKDSGNILPGHGGMLDRFDSSLMAIPVAVVYIYTLQFIG